MARARKGVGCEISRTRAARVDQFRTSSSRGSACPLGEGFDNFVHVVDLGASPPSTWRLAGTAPLAVVPSLIGRSTRRA
ncbi:hypothetical protein [Enhygromyxa salina]|uniref:hypothetical protein n=1 Tax=Enhygromyxa salina TaxID=215803 RepID=UPI0015E5C46E|nr:hypothetical protein [Enhygromyxa salina]